MFHYIHIEKNAPPTGRHVFSPIWTIYELVRDINKINVLTSFHDDWAKIVTSRVFTRKTAPPPGSHETNVLTKFCENWAKNVTSRVFTCFHIEKNAPPTGGHVFFTDLDHFRSLFTSHVFQLTGTIFKLNSHIKETNVLTKFHENWAKNVTSRVFTCFHYIHNYREKCPAHWRPYINKTNVLTNFHDYWAKIVTSRVFTRKTAPSPPPPGSHETNVLTKFHENWAKNVTSRVFTCFYYIHIKKNAPPTGGHVFSPIWTIFVLVRDINKTNVLTNFHDYWAKIVTSRVFTRKTAPPTGGHVFERTGTTFKLDQHIIQANILTNFKLGRDFIGAKLLTKFHEDGTRNVVFRVFTSKCLRTDVRRTKTGQKSSPEQSAQLVESYSRIVAVCLEVGVKTNKSTALQGVVVIWCGGHL
ncbi:hypothetical protein DPMN_052300 [Dreissena polymorpha]|uniref:Uncharacterized protein n=1 Tax=Dreissena polymorpha TaxID=45954 RepID=A0A9D4HR52_DREPO|nr:hypothetical protein DPMN_052300 [Dreissena polymorpha]